MCPADSRMVLPSLNRAAKQNWHSWLRRSHKNHPLEVDNPVKVKRLTVPAPLFRGDRTTDTGLSHPLYWDHTPHKGCAG